MQKINLVVIEAKKKNKDVLQALLKACTNAHVVSMNTTLKEANDYVNWNDVHILLIAIDEYEQCAANDLKQLLHQYSLAVIIVAQNNVYEATRIVQAISSGATDYYVIKDEDNEETFAKQGHILSNKLNHVMRQLKKKQKRKAKPSVRQEKRENSSESIVKERQVRRARKPSSRGKNAAKLIAIGTSTGGPKALETIIQSLPKDFPLPIVIVQHMPAKFTASLAVRLNTIGTIAVKEAEDGEIIENGTAYIAPGNYHLEVKKNRSQLAIQLHQGAPRSGHRPSVDVMLESIAHIGDLYKIVVILTGMGKDGAVGIQKVKQLDEEAYIIVESSETTVVNGMPSAAIETNHVTDVIRIEQIGRALVDQL